MNRNGSAAFPNFGRGFSPVRWGRLLRKTRAVGSVKAWKWSFEDRLNRVKNFKAYYAKVWIILSLHLWNIKIFCWRLDNLYMYDTTYLKTRMSKRREIKWVLAWLIFDQTSAKICYARLFRFFHFNFKLLWNF